MTNDKKSQFAVHCILCGKNFYADTPITCGGTISGQPMCRTDDIKRAAQAEAFEQTAAVYDEQQLEPECPERASYCAEAIRALKEK